jgi:hypothetical protein
LVRGRIDCGIRLRIRVRGFGRNGGRCGLENLRSWLRLFNDTQPLQ